MIIKENFKFWNEHELYFISQTEKVYFICSLSLMKYVIFT